ncbi:hypothetical protein [Halorientalis litorea]|uniref:hypothetical protein n=1 Tax=Halorientalis litorea TaxID=2931977 RepID=UPI001FF5BB45|nr:hypothetical protein [Halorientalis litorea]
MRFRTLVRVARQHWNDPGWWLEKDFMQEIIMPSVFSLLVGDGVDVVEEDWDNLIILDACRFDMFEELNTIPGTLSQKRSWNSATAQFLRQNFQEGEFHDTVYVTANPKVSMALDLDAKFHDVVQVWRDGWDEKLNTVTPQVMTERTRDVAESYPNKRIISHFVQPHFPFIGQKAREWFGSQGGFEYSRTQLLNGTGSRDSANIWELAREGTVDKDRVFEAYRENLETALPHVQSLVDDLRGKSVVTSDHGNMVGEFAWPFPIRIYGHPPHILRDELVTVPWLEIDSETRKSITAETPTDDVDTEESVAADRLQNLGYID